MASKKKAGKAKKRATSNRKAMSIVRARGWDQGAIAWAKLLADPCSAAVVPPCYPTGGGVLIRSRTVITVGTGAGEIAGLVHWVPGGGLVFSNGTANPGTGFTPSTGQVVPPFIGNSFRVPNCVAACMRIIPNASELNRSGMCYLGNTHGSYVQATGSVSVNQVASQLTYSIRSPDQAAELVWLPRPQDVAGAQYISGGILSDTVTGGSALTFAYTGSPAAVGYTVQLIGVYEVPMDPGSNTTLGTINQYQPPASTTNWSEVVRTVFEAMGGTLRFASDMANEASRFASTISSVASSPGGRIAMGAARLALTM